MGLISCPEPAEFGQRAAVVVFDEHGVDTNGSGGLSVAGGVEQRRLLRLDAALLQRHAVDAVSRNDGNIEDSTSFG